MRPTPLSLTGLTLTTAALLTTAVASMRPYDGYTFCFNRSEAYLYSMNKKCIHTWTLHDRIEGCADLLRDSSIIIAIKADGSMFSSLALCHGRFQIISWNGDVVWDYTYVGKDYHPHHDIEPVYRTNDPHEKPTFLVPCYTMWGERIVELRPAGRDSAEIVWVWNAADHVCYRDCAGEAQLLDVFKTDPAGMNIFNSTSDAMHVNNLSYNRVRDQIILSSKGYHELLIIDHSTTTAQAATAEGGRYGHGGDFLYRWGNPENYGAGDSCNLKFSGQHHCCWVPDTMPGTGEPVPGSGNFLSVNNSGGHGRGRIIEINNPYKNGWYNRCPDLPFGPDEPCWTFTPDVMIESNEGSIQKLPNGNYLLCTGGFNGGYSSRSGSSIQEIAPDGADGGTVVWELTGFGTSNEAYRYAYGYLDGEATSLRAQSTPIRQGEYRIRCLPDRGRGGVTISVPQDLPDASLTLYTIDGRKLCGLARHQSPGEWTIGPLPAGTYLIKLHSGKTEFTATIII